MNGLSVELIRGVIRRERVKPNQVSLGQTDHPAVGTVLDFRRTLLFVSLCVWTWHQEPFRPIARARPVPPFVPLLRQDSRKIETVAGFPWGEPLSKSLVTSREIPVSVSSIPVVWNDEIEIFPLLCRLCVLCGFLPPKAGWKEKRFLNFICLESLAVLPKKFSCTFFGDAVIFRLQLKITVSL